MKVLDFGLAKLATEGEALAGPLNARRSRIAWIAGGLALLGALAVPTALYLREAPPPEIRLQIVTPPKSAPLQFSLSLDGRSIVFVASESSDDAAQRLYLRSLDKTEVTPIPEPRADAIRSGRQNRSIGFFVSEKLFRIRFPAFLPGGQQFLYYAAGDSDFSGICLGSISSHQTAR